MIAQELFSLLPGFHRTRDAAAGGSLKLLMDVLGTQLDAVRANIEVLGDCWFIETCPDWLVPYVADLVAVDPTLSAGAQPELRALVANTVTYRRSRGTLATLGHAATAASGWPVLAIELDHGLVGGLAEGLAAARTAGERPLASAACPMATRVQRRSSPSSAGPITQGGPADIGLLVWRTRSFGYQNVRPRRLTGALFSFHPLGLRMPLFTLASRMPTAGGPALLTEMPQPLTRRLLKRLQEEGARLPLAIHLLREGRWRSVPSERLVVVDLRDERRAAALIPASQEVLVDPESGRFVTGAAADAVAVDYACGAPVAIGAGAHGRADRLVMPETTTWVAHVDTRLTEARMDPLDGSRRFPSLMSALEACPVDQTDVLIQIADNDLHVLGARTEAPPTADGPGLVQQVGAGRVRLSCAGRGIAIQALDGFCPCVEGEVVVEARGAAGRLILAGLLWHGRLVLAEAGEAILMDCTVWPDTGAAVVSEGDPAAHRALTLERCVTGAVRLPAPHAALAVTGSIVDGRGQAAVGGPRGGPPGPTSTLIRSTFLGGLDLLDEPSLQDCLVAGALISRQRHLPAPTVSFKSRQFGHPDYAVPVDDSFAATGPGAQDGGPLGAFHDCRPAARARGMARVVDDYLPEGLSVQFFFMT